MYYIVVALLVLFLMLLRRPRSKRTDTLFLYTTLVRSGFEARVAAVVERRGPEREARQRVHPGARVQLVLQLGGGAGEDLPARLRVVYHVNSCPLRGGEEAGDLVLIHGLSVGDVDQLVVGRHAFFLGIEATPGKAFQFKLIELEIAEGADHRVDLARHQRRRQRPVHVDQLDIIEGESMPSPHGAEQRLLDSRPREAHPDRNTAR